ncbi:MAG: recombinase RecA [Planctomycetes bacterium]|nr:recombinase RecA [Planctomycetota bacterium]
MSSKAKSIEDKRSQVQKTRESIGEILDLVKKNCGEDSIMRLGDRGTKPIATISTGSLSLDFALGCGGFPRGRIVEIFGPESSGKTTLAMHALANAQRDGGIGAIIDAEHAFDPAYAGKLGIDVQNLLISQPDSGEHALKIAELLAKSGAVDVIVIDSVAALVPKAELEGEYGESHMGLQARLMSQALRKLTAIVSHSKVCLIFINQIREKIGVVYGSPETTTGGRALKFYSSLRLEVRRATSLKKGEECEGIQTKVKVVKNKLAPPFKSVEFDIIFGKGINYVGDIIDLAVSEKIVNRAGAWYSFGEIRLGQGRSAACDFLGSPDQQPLLNEIVHQIMRVKGMVKDEAAA